MTILMFAIVNLLVSNISCLNPIPSTTGKFFYTSMRAGENTPEAVHGSHRVDALVSDKN